MSNAFGLSLKKGQAGESLIAHWLRSRGCHVLPVYEVEMNTGKGPRLFSATGQLIAPDALVFNGDNIFWAEVKHKTIFTWHRNSGTWQTGIDLRHYEQYLEVADKTNKELWLFFFHAGGLDPIGGESPSGLFGNTLDVLRNCAHHTSDKWGKTGMIYWEIKSLKRLATYEQVTQSVFQTT